MTGKINSKLQISSTAKAAKTATARAATACITTALMITFGLAGNGPAALPGASTPSSTPTSTSLDTVIDQAADTVQSTTGVDTPVTGNTTPDQPTSNEPTTPEDATYQNNTTPQQTYDYDTYSQDYALHQDDTSTTPQQTFSYDAPAPATQDSYQWSWPTGDDSSSFYTPTWGPRSTKQVMDLLKGQDPQTIARIMAPFPVAGYATYSDDWGAPRYNPSFHLHEGTDIFASKGTPVIATTNGVISNVTTNAQMGGVSFRLTGSDLTHYYYAHLDALALTAYEGSRVAEGDVIGFVGATGNAEGGPTHLHFEVHPAGGMATPPVSYLDTWLAQALTKAQALVAPNTTANPASQPATAQALSPQARAAEALRKVAASLAPPPQERLNPMHLLPWAAGLALIVLVRMRRRRLATQQT